MIDPILLLSIAELTDGYRSGALSPVDIAQRHLARATELEPRLNAFQIFDEAGALAAASKSAARWQARSPAGPLDGVPMTIKDNVDFAGFPTRSGSTTTPETPALDDAPVVARLRESGAVFLGKTTLPEFGWKGVTDSTLRRAATRNPWDTARSPGGSSGGAAACVAAGIGTVAFGNDGGGSIRLPAGLSGVFGYKPNFGRVPHYPMEGLFSNLLAGGPISRSVTDAITTLGVMARPDDRDWHALPPPQPDWLDNPRPRLAGLRIALSTDLGGVPPDAQIADGIASAVAALREAGAEITEIGPVIAELEPVFDAFWKAAFGHKLRNIPRERWDELDPGYRRVAEMGLDITIAQLLDSEIARARLHQDFVRLFRSYDLLLTPTTPHAAPLVDIAYHSQGYDRWRDGVPYTLPFNLTGHPAASIPCGLTPNGLPVGLQVVGPTFADRLVLEACLAMEAVFGFGAAHREMMDRV
jgi:aspartyl-tRNA(Asn)/glutamyl-tRNA(Gln) amidotransferase subunit A